jgi:hypothetical protein
MGRQHAQRRVVRVLSEPASVLCVAEDPCRKPPYVEYKFSTTKCLRSIREQCVLVVARHGIGVLDQLREDVEKGEGMIAARLGHVSPCEVRGDHQPDEPTLPRAEARAISEDDAIAEVGWKWC